MPRSNPITGMPSSSPHSLGDASHHDTPSTNLTAFSPNDVAHVNAGRYKLNVHHANDDDATGSEYGTNK